MSSWKGRLLHWRGLALSNPWAFLATLVVGAALAFVYSYVPLHTVNNRKIERLEASVLKKEVRIDGLARELASLREGVDEAPDAEQIAALESQLDEAERARKLADDESKKAKRRVRNLEAERAEWKRKIASLEAAAKEAQLAAAPPPAPVEPVAPADVVSEALASESEPAKAIAGAAPPSEAIPAAPAPE